jgi:hypothetical protein
MQKPNVKNPPDLGHRCFECWPRNFAKLKPYIKSVNFSYLPKSLALEIVESNDGMVFDWIVSINKRNNPEEQSEFKYLDKEVIYLSLKENGKNDGNEMLRYKFRGITLTNHNMSFPDLFGKFDYTHIITLSYEEIERVPLTNNAFPRPVGGDDIIAGNICTDLEWNTQIELEVE